MRKRPWLNWGYTARVALVALTATAGTLPLAAPRVDTETASTPRSPGLAVSLWEQTLAGSRCALTSWLRYPHAMCTPYIPPAQALAAMLQGSGAPELIELDLRDNPLSPSAVQSLVRHAPQLRATSPLRRLTHKTPQLSRGYATHDRLVLFWPPAPHRSRFKRRGSSWW